MEMTLEEFNTLMVRMDETYSAQPKINETQKSIFYAALKDLNYKDVVVAFVEHTKIDQWKPTVPKQLLMHLPKDTAQSERFVRNFFDRKPITDVIAVKVLKIMGHDRLRKSFEKDLPNLIDEFDQHYKAIKFKEHKKKLPDIVTKTAKAIQWKK
jgi:16S rRNA G1207 methylase RsmC